VTDISLMVDTEARVTRLSGRLSEVHRQIVDAAARSGRSAGDVTLVGVSKTVDRSAVDAAYAAGLRDFGENRVQDAREKFAAEIPADLRLHLIGSLQTNKARFVPGLFQLVHSLDRAELADELNKRAANAGVFLPVLIQVNVAREPQKHGCDVDELPGLIDHTLGCEQLALHGFMTMAPLDAAGEQARPYFAALTEQRERMRARYPDLPLTHLSMGMTNDYPIAVEEGATIVRVGRAIFAETGGV
jgi:hypothetical protein